MLNSLFVGLISWLFSLFLYSPRLTLFLGEGSGATRRDDLLAQCFEPFTRILNEPILSYRIVQPLLANSLGWCGERRDTLALLGSPGIAYIALILTLAIFHFSLRKRFSNSLSLLTTFGLATTHLTQWVNTHWGHPDSLTLMPISLLLLSRQSILVTLVTIIGCLNDERMILSIPFILLWWWPEEKSWKKILHKLSPLIFSFLIGIIITLIIRFSLEQGLIGSGIINPYHNEGFLFTKPLLRIFNPSYWTELVVMLFLGFRWFWLVPIIAAFISIRKTPHIRSIIFNGSFVLVIFATFAVVDVSRSTSFFFPIIPVGMEIIKDQANWSESQLKLWISWIIGLNVVTPAAKVFGMPTEWWGVNPLEWAVPALPLPINLWNWLVSPNGAMSW